MSKALTIAVCALVLVLPATAQKGGAQKGGGSTTSNLPIVNSLSPSSKEAGSGTFIMTVTGMNFTSGSVVRWNGSNITTGYVSSTQLNASVSSSYVASTGTASITVFTSGRKGGTSNTLTFTITTPTTTTTTTTTAPPPSPTPLSITTTSLPATTVNGSFSSSVAATGGTPAYGWSLVNGGGSLPPGLTLQANGSIAGTPSQSGTFTFTTQASDSASQIAQKVLSITVGADPNATPPPPSTDTSGIVFQDGFEGGFTSFGNVDNRLTINTDPQFVRSGSRSAQVYFEICGDSTNSACRSEHQDDDHGPTIYKEGLRHFFLRGYVYIKHPEPDARVDNLGRKLFYVWENSSNPKWSVILDIASQNEILKLRWSLQNGNIGGTTFVSDCGTVNPPPITGLGCNMQFDTWYSIEMEIKNNTTSASPWNGEVRLWVNGEKVYDVVGWSLNRQYDLPLRFFWIGQQVDRNYWWPVKEYRYWDDIVLSTSYIGP